MSATPETETIEATNPQSNSAEAVKMSAEARRTNYILAVGVASLWLFAIWSLVALFEGGLSGVEVVSLLLLGAICIVAPLVVWTLLSDAAARYAVTDDALHYSSIGGLSVRLPWDQMTVERAVQGGDAADDDGPGGSVAVGADDSDAAEFREGKQRVKYVVASGNEAGGAGMAHFLHTLSHGRKLPLHAGIEGRGTLEEQVLKRLGAPVDAQPVGGAMIDGLIEKDIRGD
jgi:hypothetical protein